MLFTATIFLQFIFSNSRYIEIKFRISMGYDGFTNILLFFSELIFKMCFIRTIFQRFSIRLWFLEHTGHSISVSFFNSNLPTFHQFFLIHVWRLVFRSWYQQKFIILWAILQKPTLTLPMIPVQDITHPTLC